MAYAGKNFVGFKVMADLIGGPGAEPPSSPSPTGAGEFSKICKEIHKKIAINELFLPIFQIFQNYGLNLCALERKTQLVRNFVRKV